MNVLVVDFKLQPEMESNPLEIFNDETEQLA